MDAKFERRTGLCEREETGTVIGKKLARAIISVVQIEMDANEIDQVPTIFTLSYRIHEGIDRKGLYGSPCNTFSSLHSVQMELHAWAQRTKSTS